MKLIGWLLSALTIAVHGAAAMFHLFGAYFARDALLALYTPGGYTLDQAPILGVAALTGAVLYAVPRTSVLGAIVLTGFLGGAIATELYIGPEKLVSALICIALGVIAWAGLWFRMPRLRAILPDLR